MRDDAKRARWETRSEAPLIVLALVFLGAYAWPILDPGLAEEARDLCRAAGAVVWLVFAVDLIVRLTLAEDRRRFLRGAWLDVISLALPMLRPLRALRAVLALNALARRGQTFARGRAVAAVAAAVSVVGFVAALAMLDAERADPDANIRSFGDAVWWAVTTVTTVGYGDRYPTTTGGRYVAAALMITGIALLGVVTAALASWFVEKMSEVQQAEQRTEQEIAQLAAEIRALREQLASRRML